MHNGKDGADVGSSVSMDVGSSVSMDVGSSVSMDVGSSLSMDADGVNNGVDDRVDDFEGSGE